MKATLTRGTEVETSIKGTLTSTDNGRAYVTMPNGAVVKVPTDSIKVTWTPPFPEPEVGCVLKDAYYGGLFVHQSDGWRYAPLQANALSLREVCDKVGHDELVRLVEDPSKSAWDVKKNEFRFWPTRRATTRVTLRAEDNDEFSIGSQRVDKWVARDIALILLKATGGL